MILSHLMVKVDDLDREVHKWRQNGFAVEYGSKGRAYNALIYFSEGPYIELVSIQPMPAIARAVFKLLGKGYALQRVTSWETSPMGPMAVVLENHSPDLSTEVAQLASLGIRCFETKRRRVDVHSRVLKFRLGFPEQQDVPLLMSAFNRDPRPVSFVHANGCVGIRKLRLGVSQKGRSVIEVLCDDASLELVDGSGEIEVEYRYTGDAQGSTSSK